MAKKNKGKKNKEKKVAEASSTNPIPNSPPPPPPVSPNRTIADQRRLYKKMEDDALAIATSAFKKWDRDSSIAKEIKKEFDSRYGPAWHCIVGSNFVSSVYHEQDFYFYLYFGSKDILLFKCGKAYGWWES